MFTYTATTHGANTGENNNVIMSAKLDRWAQTIYSVKHSTGSG